jgi:hypothetical protein
MPDLILADQPEIKNALVMLHKSGVQLIIPDYHGSTYCGEWTCFPAKMGWDCEYIPA